MEVENEQLNKASLNDQNNNLSQDDEKESIEKKQKDKEDEKSGEDEEEYEESEEEEESEDDDIEIVLNADNMNLTNVGDASDLIKQRQKLAMSGQSLQPVQTSAPTTNNQILNSILTSIDKSSLKKIPDLDSIEDKPWTKPGVDISDYFNYGFTEETWRLYLHKQFQMRQEFQSQNKIKVLQSSTKEDKPVEKKEDKREEKERLDKDIADKLERERIEKEKMERYERERYERERYERGPDFDRRRDGTQERHRYRDRERDRYDRDRYERSEYERGREDYEYNRHRKKRSRSRDEYKVEDSWESERKRRR